MHATTAILALAGLASTTLAAPAPLNPATHTLLPRSSLTGTATYYGGNISGGTCSFTTLTLPSSIYGTALSDSNWASAGLCGACLRVSYNSQSITAMVVDQCPGCGANALDLFPAAFSALAEPTLGHVQVAWEVVDCEAMEGRKLKLVNKSGTSRYWFSMQVVNAVRPVVSLEVSTDGGKTWGKTTRQEYNYFENSSGFGADTVDVRVTDTAGNKVVVKGVSVASGSSVEAASNFA
ncbi:RlpA-like double-psi beta-barrel-protein domain-containing protein-containing protein [Geopyxis carbonaria]|nr:RlpA-like double-psi beta-barrel-protein domain-containing protein-containing protein [Geopyxis carbonaria]